MSPVPEEHLDLQAALGTGYSESKWVAETILKRASEITGIQTTIVRVGQLCGDSVSGGWTTKEPGVTVTVLSGVRIVPPPSKQK